MRLVSMRAADDRRFHSSCIEKIYQDTIQMYTGQYERFPYTRHSHLLLHIIIFKCNQV